MELKHKSKAALHMFSYKQIFMVYDSEIENEYELKKIKSYNPSKMSNS